MSIILHITYFCQPKRIFLMRLLLLCRSARIQRQVLLLLIACMLLAAKPGTAVSQSAIELSTEALPDFREVLTGHFSDVQYYYVSASGLDDPLHLAADAPFKVSVECHDGFSPTLTLEHGDGEVDHVRVYVRLFPDAEGTFEGAILHASGEAEEKSLSVSGSSISDMIPEGYYETATGTGSQLKTQLHQVISGHSVQSYSQLWDHFTVTDATFDGKVWDIYSHTPCEEPPYVFTFYDDQDTGTGGTEEGDVYNREHTMPRSWFGGQVNPMHTDLFHIYPVDKWVNARRANYPYGAVDAADWTSMIGGKLGPNVAGSYSGTAFEPVDEYKGDLARAFLYMVTRYEDRISSWAYTEYGNAMLDHQAYPGYEPWVIDMLLDWHENDPVSQKEILRNQEVYDIQGNRNPFVDHPEFVEMIWGDTTVHVGNDLQGSSIRIYPNPAVDEVFIESMDEMLALRVFSATGALMLDRQPAGTQARLSTGSWPSGVYVLRVYGRAATDSRRILVK